LRRCQELRSEIGTVSHVSGVNLAGRAQSGPAHPPIVFMGAVARHPGYVAVALRNRAVCQGLAPLARAPKAPVRCKSVGTLTRGGSA
jgi:hypothetical protein